MNKGTVYVLSGPSGSGKDTVLGLVCERFEDLQFSISCVTREKRGSDKEDGKYSFLTVDEFKTMLANGEFLEYNIYLGNFYGTPRKPVEDAVNAGKDIVIEIDVNGAAQIKKALPDAVTIFVMPPSIQALKYRLEKRKTDSPEAMNKRLNEAMREIKCAKDYDYIIVNDDLSVAVEDMCSILSAQRLKSQNMINTINEVLENA